MSQLRRPLWIVAAAIALTLLIVGGGMLGLWQRGDHLVFRALYLPEPPTPASGLRIIDVPYPDELKNSERGVEVYRETLGRVLMRLSELRMAPRTVVIDVHFLRDPAGQASVIAGIKALQAKGTRVVATVAPVDRHGHDSADFMQWHNEAIYTNAVDAYGHTQLDEAMGLLKYERELSPDAVAGRQKVGTLSIPALPPVAVLEPELVYRLPASMIIPLGNDDAFKGQVHRSDIASGSIVPPLPEGTAISHVILGSLDADSDNKLNRPGPLLLAWAMSDLMAGKGSVARAPLSDWRALLALCAVGASVAYLSFLVAFWIGLKRVALTAMWRFSVKAALGAFGLAVVALLLIEMVSVQVGWVIPVTLPTLIALIASTSALYRARGELERRRSNQSAEDAMDMAPLEHDVFISYAHQPKENIDWVEKNIFAPLLSLQRPDGLPMRIFFDKQSIEGGADWQRKIDNSLAGTQVFVAVFSNDYFASRYCMYESSTSKARWVTKELQFLPITRIADDRVFELVNPLQVLPGKDLDAESFKQRVMALWTEQNDRRQSLMGVTNGHAHEGMK